MSSTGWPRSARRAASRSSPTKSSPTTSSRPARQRRAGRAAARRDVLSFALGGLSKSVGLPQVKLGWIAVGGPDRARRRRARAARADLRHLSVGLDAGAAGGGDAARARRRDPRADRRADRRRTTARCRAAAVGRRAAACCRARAAGTPCCRCRRSRPKRSSCCACSADGVLTHPGYFFDFPRESFLIVSLLPPEAAFADGLSRVLRHFDCSVGRQ